MSRKRANILTIGGFDPSAGAGVLADAKTFEQHRMLGMAVNTANTVQTEGSFHSVNWVSEQLIHEQLDALLSEHSFEYCKVGLVPNFALLLEIKAKMPNTRLIWDPVLSASAGFNMNHSLEALDTVLDAVYFITPNWNEAMQLTNQDSGFDAAKQLAQKCNVYLKGGHRTDRVGMDTVFFEGTHFNLRAKGQHPTEKHGSGCILSSALAANLTAGFPIRKACLKTKEYVSRVLDSNETLLGYHK